MRIIDANGQELNVAMVREAVKCLPERAIARMHPTQLHYWSSVGIAVKNVAVAKSDEPLDLGHQPPMKMARHVIHLDMWFPEDRIRFELDGRDLAAIVNLRTPLPFVENAVGQ